MNIYIYIHTYMFSMPRYFGMYICISVPFLPTFLTCSLGNSDEEIFRGCRKGLPSDGRGKIDPELERVR